MIRFLLDANIVSSIVRDPDGTAAQRYETVSQACCTSIVVASELRYGIAKQPESRRARRTADLLSALPSVAFDAPADAHYGALRAALERAGTPIGGNDLLIAAHALALDCVMVTANDREFRRVPGLKVENWLTDQDQSST